MEEDLFSGYAAGMMSPGRIAQLSVDGRPNRSTFPTLGEVLSEQTESILPSSGLSSQVKSSPVIVPDLIGQPVEKEVPPATNNISTVNNSTVNNSFDYSTKAFPEFAKSIINNILSTLSETYAQEKVVNSNVNTMKALSMSPSTVINQIDKSVDSQEQINSISQNISKANLANSIASSNLNLVTNSNRENKTQPSSSNSMQIMNMNKTITQPSTSYTDSIYSLINSIGPSMTSLAESNKVELIEESNIDTTSNFLSAMENLQSVTDNSSQNLQSINNKQYGNDVSVKSTNPIKNKSLVTQILNPPNPVAQGVDNLGKVITSTTNTMTSSITDKLSTLTPPAQTESAVSNQIVNNNSSNTVNQSSQLSQPGDKEPKPAEEMAGSAPSLSEYYLQAIHDSLIIHGIKIRTM